MKYFAGTQLSRRTLADSASYSLQSCKETSMATLCLPVSADVLNTTVHFAAYFVLISGYLFIYCLLFRHKIQGLDVIYLLLFDFWFVVETRSYVARAVPNSLYIPVRF